MSIKVFFFILLMATGNARPANDANVQCAALIRADFSAVQDAPPRVVSAELMAAVGNYPSYCQVDATVPTNPLLDLQVRIPVARWNGKFLAMDSPSGGDICDAYVKRGYACVPIFRDGRKDPPKDRPLRSARGNGSRVENIFLWTHTLTLSAKAIVERYYDKAPERSYYMGCSGGGHTALVQAQFFPWDYDGIVAGDPNLDIAEWSMRALWSARNLQDRNGQPLFTAASLETLNDAVLAACDRDDGVEDGVLGNAVGCRIDPGELVCKTGQKDRCLMPAQVTAARHIYAGPTTSTGYRITTAGVLPGSELLWNTMRMFAGIGAIESSFEDATPKIDANNFDFDRDYKRLGQAALEMHNNPDLRKFKAAGGKLLMHVATNDIAQLAPGAVDYYGITENAMGGRAATETFFRLFMVPGATHCARGDGADTVDYLSYLDAWVEHGKAPDVMIAARVSDEYLAKAPAAKIDLPLDPTIPLAFTRPLFPYPLYARYTGTGDPNVAANFRPVDPRLSSPDRR